MRSRDSRVSWSIYGAKRAQPVAAGGKSTRSDSRSNKPIRSPWQPTATVQDRMVRTVRVRQRALQDPRSRGLFVQNDLRSSFVRRVWSRLWSFRVENGLAACERRGSTPGDRQGLLASVIPHGAFLVTGVTCGRGRDGRARPARDRDRCVPRRSKPGQAASASTRWRK